MAQEVWCLPSMCEPLNSIPSTTETKQNKRKNLENVVYIHNEILFSLTKKENLTNATVWLTSKALC
jgi:hypothetical protein